MTTSNKIVRGGEGHVYFTLTVPFPCYLVNAQDTEPEDGCVLSLELVTPSLSECDSKLTAVQSCAFQIKRNDWDKKQSVKIQHVDNSGYDLIRDYTIKYITNFRTDSAGEIWNNIALPELKVICDGFAAIVGYLELRKVSKRVTSLQTNKSIL